MTKSIIVELGKSINGEKLERILLSAARAVNLDCNSANKYKTIYSLNPVRKKKIYDNTYISLYYRGNLNNETLLLMSTYIDKKETTTYLLIFHESERDYHNNLKNYLNAVSKKISHIK